MINSGLNNQLPTVTIKAHFSVSQHSHLGTSPRTPQMNRTEKNKDVIIKHPIWKVERIQMTPAIVCRWQCAKQGYWMEKMQHCSSKWAEYFPDSEAAKQMCYWTPDLIVAAHKPLQESSLFHLNTTSLQQLKAPDGTFICDSDTWTDSVERDSWHSALRGVFC